MMLLVDTKFDRMHIVKDRSMKIDEIGDNKLFVFAFAPNNSAFLFFQDAQSEQVLIDYPILVHGDTDDELITHASVIHSELFNSEMGLPPRIVSDAPKKIVVSVT